MSDSVLTDAATKFGQVIEALAVFAAIMILILFLVGRVTGRLQRPLTAAVFLGPAVVLLIIGLVYPAIRTFYLSLRGADLINAKFIGTKNYVWAFTSDNVRDILVTTLLWIIIAPVVATALGLTLALLVDRLRGQAVYKSLIFMPMAISFVGASIIWKLVYDYKDQSLPQTGLLSQVVMWLGWKNPPNWLLTSPLNNFLLMVILVWVQTGFAMVVLSAAIKGIPDDVVEAARIDGAKGMSMFARVTVPMIRATLVVVLVTVMITTLKIFDIVRTTTGGNFGTQVLANEMYDQSFVSANTGRGAALAVILFVAVLPLVVYNVIQLRKERANR